MNKKSRYFNTLFDVLLLAAIEIFMMVYLDVRYLFLDTIVTGGDTASWYGIADHMMRVLLPEGRLTGWDLGNFCGYPNFSFYFIPPFLLAALASTLFAIPLTITLKGVIALGIVLLPLMTYLGLRAMAYRFPIPAIGASASLLFLFNESYTMFGGNILSTLSGEFCYMIAFALFAYFIGSLCQGMTTGNGLIKNGILLGLIGLTHLFVFIPAVCLLIYWFLAKGRLRYLFTVSQIAFGLMAFWILPLVAYRDPFTTPVYMIWQPFVNWRYAFMGIGLGLLFIGPRLAIAALSSPGSWGLPLLSFSGLGTFTLSYLVMQYLALALEDGIHTVVATPHTLDGLYDVTLAQITEAVVAFERLLRTRDLDLRVCMGSDAHLCPGMADRIKNGQVGTINNTGKYFLMELPPQTLPSGIKEEIFALKVQGITPIITHPERHPAILRERNLLYDFIAMGAISQITAMSLTGEFGETVQQCAQELLKHRLVHVIASDAHSADSRPPLLSRAVNEAAELTGSESFATSLVNELPAKILAGEPVEIPEPIRIRGRR